MRIGFESEDLSLVDPMDVVSRNHHIFLRPDFSHHEVKAAGEEFDHQVNFRVIKLTSDLSDTSVSVCISHFSARPQKNT